MTSTVELYGRSFVRSRRHFPKKASSVASLTAEPSVYAHDPETISISPEFRKLYLVGRSPSYENSKQILLPLAQYQVSAVNARLR